MTTLARPPLTAREMLNKVPEVTLYFWIIKVLCTTVGETAADYLATQRRSRSDDDDVHHFSPAARHARGAIPRSPLHPADLLAWHRADQCRRHTDH